MIGHLRVALAAARQAAGTAVAVTLAVAIGIGLFIGGLALSFALHEAGWEVASVLVAAGTFGAAVGYGVLAVIVAEKVGEARDEAQRRGSSTP